MEANRAARAGRKAAEGLRAFGRLVVGALDWIHYGSARPADVCAVAACRMGEPDEPGGAGEGWMAGISARGALARVERGESEMGALGAAGLLSAARGEAQQREIAIRLGKAARLHPGEGERIEEMLKHPMALARTIEMEEEKAKLLPEGRFLERARAWRSQAWGAQMEALSAFGTAPEAALALRSWILERPEGFRGAIMEAAMGAPWPTMEDPRAADRKMALRGIGAWAKAGGDAPLERLPRRWTIRSGKAGAEEDWLGAIAAGMEGLSGLSGWSKTDEESQKRAAELASEWGWQWREAVKAGRDLGWKPHRNRKAGRSSEANLLEAIVGSGWPTEAKEAFMRGGQCAQAACADLVGDLERGEASEESRAEFRRRAKAVIRCAGLPDLERHDAEFAARLSMGAKASKSGADAELEEGLGREIRRAKAELEGERIGLASEGAGAAPARKSKGL